MIHEFKAKQDLHEINELPDPFMKPDGSRISSIGEWPVQRAYIKDMLAHYLYGTMPPAPGNTVGEIISQQLLYDDLAKEEIVKLSFGPDHSLSFRARIVRPNNPGRYPVVTANVFGLEDGSPYEREAVTERYYVLADFDKEDLAPDNGLFWEADLYQAYPGYTWGAIALWSWGHSRLIDYLETTGYADSSAYVATGHSRGGKIALCAAVYDERISLCAANDSGCGGAGCFRFLGGRMGEGTGVQETLGSMTESFPHWFCGNLNEFGRHSRDYDPDQARVPVADADEMMKQMMELFAQPDFLGKTGDERFLPFDLHMVRAAIAPRAVISTDALSDTWANPYGTQLSWLASNEVFSFLGVPNHNALHQRDGGHKYQAQDWEVMLNYADHIFRGRTLHPNTMVQEHGIPDIMSAMLPILDWKQDHPHFSWSKPETAD